MRDLFHWDRTTTNFFRYISNNTVPAGAQVWAGRHVVVYIPRRGATEPPFIEAELIVAHMLPKELLLKPFGEPEAERRPFRPGTYETTIAGVKKIDPSTLEVSFGDIERQRVNDLCPKPFDWHAQPFGHTRVHRSIEDRLTKLEASTSVLFKAVYWILRKLRVVK